MVVFCLDRYLGITYRASRITLNDSTLPVYRSINKAQIGAISLMEVAVSIAGIDQTYDFPGIDVGRLSYIVSWQDDR